MTDSKDRWIEKEKERERKRKREREKESSFDLGGVGGKSDI